MTPDERSRVLGRADEAVGPGRSTPPGRFGTKGSARWEIASISERIELKITSVKTAATTGHCMHLWVRVETDAGITGLGECVHGGHQAIAIIQELRRG